MNKKVLMVFVLGFLFMNAIAFGQNGKNILRLSVPNYAPFTYEKNGDIKGLGVVLVNKVMKELKIQYSLSFVPTYGRALQNLIKDQNDGFFLASHNTKRDDWAVFSEPLTLNRWCWFFLGGSNMSSNNKNFKNNAKVGTILGTNQEAWLKGKRYTITATPKEASILPKLIKADRINTIFGAELVVENVFENADKNLFKKEVQVEQKFGMYISKKYLSNHPGFMKRLNAAIKKVCK